MQNPAYSAAQFLLELDGDKPVGFCRSVEGGGIKTDILTYRKVEQGKWSFSRQLAAKPKFEELTVQVGMSMSEIFYKWIEDFFSGQGQRKTGAIISGDFHMKERLRREFFDALISEVALPGCNAADKNSANMSVKIATEAQEVNQGDGSPLKQDFGVAQLEWTTNNFFFTFDQLNDQCFARTTRIDGFRVRQQILEYHAGSGFNGGPTIHTGPGVIMVPGMIEFDNLSIYIPEVDAADVIAHFKKYGVEHRTKQARGTGELTYLGHDNAELCTVTFEGMDIAGIMPDRADATTYDVKQVKIEFTCESMKFNYKANSQNGPVK